MHIDGTFKDREALRNAWLDGFSEGALFLAGKLDVSVGTPIVLRVSSESMGIGVFVEGVVHWRRMDAGRGNTLATSQPGIAVRGLPSSANRFSFLRRWSLGELDRATRSAWRYPASLPVVVSSGRKQTTRLMHSSIVDISKEGALVTTPAPLTSGTTMLLDFLVPSPRMFQVNIVWASVQRAGARLRFDNGADRADWQKLVDNAESDFKPELRLSY